MQFDASSEYLVHVKAGSREHFETSLSLAFNGRFVTAYGDYGDFGLVYFWFRSTVGMFEPPILKTKNEFDEYVLHYPKEFHTFAIDQCVGDVMGFAWDWLHDDSLIHTDTPNLIGFDITTDPGYNGTDIMCIIRRTYPEY